MKAKKISIILLTCNNLEKARKCLDSLEYTLKDKNILEWLILDNNSGDGTAEYIRNFSKKSKKIKVIYSKSNLGCAGGRKKLMSLTGGGIILILDSDVIVKDKGFIAKLVKALDKKNVGIAGYFGSKLYAKNMQLISVRVPEFYSGYVDFVGGCCQIFRKNILKKGCSIDESYSPYGPEDIDFCLQIKKKTGLRTYVVSGKNRALTHLESKTNRSPAFIKKTHNSIVLNYPLADYSLIWTNFWANLYLAEESAERIIGKLGIYLNKNAPSLYKMLKKIKSK